MEKKRWSLFMFNLCSFWYYQLVQVEIEAKLRQKL